MERQNPIRIKHFGNVLQIILEIPWTQVTGENQWKSYIENNPIEPRPDYWAETTETILKLYKKTGSISATARASGKGYYITETVLREEQARQNKAKRQAAIDEARKLKQGKMAIKDIARIMGKSAETIRLWLKS
ncbi:hypothetical protein HF283_09765 [Acidithiobacillus ferrooxidans]|uniref:hypothetical protein n=1 Tax=Acidithiobacillus ferridurans TaxID=1232575 RepID=UPI001C06F876|nr:hypothetical protein [Acidithiobacillus ferridurans]MBU2804147.1 hypothetical protein [Acidithiobacillus ferridurans]MBU2824392.1 hypothetical protein [Acidithiobacillus ferrooxidans]